MLHSLQSNARRLAAETRGAEIAEAAAVLPLMFMMLLGIFWFGQAFSIYGAITRAAQEGARAGAVPICATCPVTNSSATNSANAVQAASGRVQAGPITGQGYTAGDFSPCPGQIVAVACAATGNPVMTNANVCVQPTVLLTNVGSNGTGVCGTSVTFQYPFQFWLPFTSLNKQKIWLTASARVRMETP